MSSRGKQAKDIDEYIARYPPDVQKILRKMRQTINRAASKAQESITYGIPTFKLDGKPLVYYAAFKNHLGFYPTLSPMEAFKKELAPYKAGKGTVQFSFGEPVPYGLVQRIVRHRVKENKLKTSRKRGKPHFRLGHPD